MERLSSVVQLASRGRTGSPHGARRRQAGARGASPLALSLHPVARHCCMPAVVTASLGYSFSLLLAGCP